MRGYKFWCQYPIEKQKYGNYVLVQFQSKGLDNDKILKDLEHNPNILAYLLSNIDQSEIVKAPAAEEAPNEESNSKDDNEEEK